MGEMERLSTISIPLMFLCLVLLLLFQTEGRSKVAEVSSCKANHFFNYLHLTIVRDEVVQCLAIAWFVDLDSHTHSTDSTTTSRSSVSVTTATPLCTNKVNLNVESISDFIDFE